MHPPVVNVSVNNLAAILRCPLSPACWYATGVLLCAIEQGRAMHSGGYTTEALGTEGCCFTQGLERYVYVTGWADVSGWEGIFVDGQ
jgi:hypothetical protein